MATHDYVLANAAGAAFRADLNNALAAIVSQNSSATEPTTTYAYMPWFDTTNGILKFRNASNTGWVIDDLNSARGSVTMHATTMDLWAEPKIVDGNGSAVTITDIADAPQAGAVRILYPVAGTTITDGATFDVDGGANYTTAAGDALIFEAVTTSTFKVHIVKADGTSIAGNAATAVPPVRQTVLSGPVDSNGLPSFGGSTGTTTVTASGTLVATAANGTDNRTGSITNPSWTGLSSNGTMYLYLDIAADGSCTTGRTTLAPNYQWGGTYSTTNNQHTFNIQEMTMKVGNGSVASQVYRVFVGEVTVAGGVVTAITWYALMGRYVSGYTNTLPGSASSVSKNHNIGTTLIKTGFRVKNLTAEASYQVGDVENAPWRQSGTSNSSVIVPVVRSRLSMQASTGNTLAIGGFDPTNGGAFLMTAAYWAYELWAERSW